jgi:replicative DNA helicase
VEKLLLLYILTKQINLEDVNLAHVSNPLAFKILKTILRLAKREEDMPTFDGLKLLFKESEQKSEALKLSAYLDVCASSDTSIPPEEVIKALKTSYALTQVESNIADIAESAINKDLDSLTESVKQLQASVDGTRSVKSTLFGDEIDNNIASVPNAFGTLNDMGCQLSGLVIIGGPSGGGKSMLVVNQVADSLMEGIPCAYFSLEMPLSILNNRLLSNLAEVELSDLMKDTYVGKSHVDMPKATRDKVNVVLDAFRKGDAYGRLNMYDTVFSADDIKAEVKRLARSGTKLIIIDYLGLVNFSGGWVELKAFVIELNQICLQYGVVIMLPTQVTIEKDSAGQVTMTTKGSVEIFNSASLGMLLYQTPESLAADLQELIIVKSRNGEKPKIALERRLNNAKFIDLGLLE